jgi:uncharacterized protein
MKTKEKIQKKDVDNFLALKKLAIIGVSRTKTKFGNAIYKELKQKNYSVFPVTPRMDTFEGDTCYKDLKSLPETVDGAVISVHRDKTLQALKEAAEAGITHIWIQQGSVSQEAVAFCKENNIAFISGKCILMFAEPVTSIHKFHRWICKIFGMLPK